ncbi:MAG: hypothetical protein EPO21_03955 [Chloroflexota bacterium]|nr:MAG: hypothetical protein EPO21_03955 [Chloroflexota bacterium]
MWLRHRLEGDPGAVGGHLVIADVKADLEVAGGREAVVAVDLSRGRRHLTRPGAEPEIAPGDEGIILPVGLDHAPLPEVAIPALPEVEGARQSDTR